MVRFQEITVTQDKVTPPFLSPVKFDKNQNVLVDLRGTVIYDCGRWAANFSPKVVEERGNFLADVLNGKIKVEKNKKTGVIEFLKEV